MAVRTNRTAAESGRIRRRLRGPGQPPFLCPIIAQYCSEGYLRSGPETGCLARRNSGATHGAGQSGKGTASRGGTAGTAGGAGWKTQQPDEGISLESSRIEFGKRLRREVRTGRLRSETGRPIRAAEGSGRGAEMAGLGCGFSGSARFRTPGNGFAAFCPPPGFW